MTTDVPLKLAVIIGSVREGRVGPVFAEWITAHAATSFEVDVIDLADHADLPLAFPAKDAAPSAEIVAAVSRLTPRLEAADAFVVVTPEYNHSYPAALKNLVDWHFTQWQAKPVGFVSYGGVSGGLRAVEHLRGVFAEMHAVTVRDQVSFADYWTLFGEDGGLTPSDAAEAGAKALLGQLDWWARALSEARASRPYAA
ncbi:NAD(P)H-dependent oxidoreductase [Actinocorallia sp. A-T 12471]|uniref:NADPH-dependent FMN reductase n=1 Tax=Actinocorallia sp. A-T 12471 TaxID=3089813 RepID=UPI0029CC1625|nr:NAD(P)H-dependent oxidoreductase [Actinocorallia sp. A-T 12471]MDX6739690.1 NAD(P)H-dependent oxidoreductase [Actinocorallia sp. A-T 12471]